MSVDGRREVGSKRKTEILDAAATLFASCGLRTSLQQIAHACDILPGSLYHHFESKEDIFGSLVRRYRRDLDEITEQAVAQVADTSQSPEERIVALATAIAECAVRHRAAVLLTLYEPRTDASAETSQPASLAPPPIAAVMRATLESARSSGYLRREIDSTLLADRICQSMFHVGIGVYHRARGANRVPGIRCRMLLHGLASRLPGDGVLDRSSARRTADEAIRHWDDGAGHSNERAARIRAVARSEFARRGTDLTTIRDIAAAAGMSIGAVYRSVTSKDELMSSILWSYAEKVTEGWSRIASSTSNPVEKLDALLWFNVNVVHRFAEEHRILSRGLQLDPPKSPNLTWTFPALLRQLEALVSQGQRTRHLRIQTGTSLDMLARCVFALVWTPENIVHERGTRTALRFGRETFLRGAAVRP